MNSYNFFYSRAGYSYDPRTETKAQGRAKCAKALAAAEKAARDACASFEWVQDDSTDSSEFSDETPPWPLWGCVMRNSSGAVVASLWGIDFGRDGAPWEDDYRRVVEAELALEAAPCSQ